MRLVCFMKFKLNLRYGFHEMFIVNSIPVNRSNRSPPKRLILRARLNRPRRKWKRTRNWNRFEFEWRPMQIKLSSNVTRRRVVFSVCISMKLCKFAADKETAELNKLQNEIDTLNKIIEQTEVDQQKSTVEWHVYENQLKVLRRSIEKQLRSKQQLEEQILEMLQDQVTTDQASAYRSKMLRELQEKRRNVELGMLSTEQQLSQVMLDLERWKSQVAQSADAIQKLTVYFW